MHANLDSATVLDLWERGLGRTAPARDAALLQALGGEAPANLGERNAMLLRAHAQIFGRALALRSHCPGCGNAVEFECDCEVLAAGLTAAPALPEHRMEAEGHAVAFRLPDAQDLADAAELEGDAFVLRLLDRCVLACSREGVAVAVRDLPQTLLDSLSRRMEALDSGAALSFAPDCPQCGTRWSAAFDVGAALWQKIHVAAERVLLEVDALARAYGWTESEVLRLTPLRRAAYLQLAA